MSDPTSTLGGIPPPGSSELSQLLSSLGVSSTGATDSTPSGEPDPLVVSRGRLTKLRADVEHGSNVLKRLAETVELSPSTSPTAGSAVVVVRLSPPPTSKSYTGRAPPFAFVGSSSSGDVAAFVERISHGENGVTYTACADKAEAILVLRNIVLALIEHFESLRVELVAEAQARIDETMKSAKEAGVVQDSSADNDNAAPPTADTVMDEDGRILNEEGLPFVDPMEVESTAQSSGRSATTVAKFKPQQKLTGEERKKWIDSVFGRFEAGEGDEDEDEDEDEADAQAQSSDDEDEATAEKKLLAKERESLIADLKDVARKQAGHGDECAGQPSTTTPPSATPPLPSSKPLKSALKPTAPPPPATPRFGSQGIRRGFLNMNPSSPAAEASSSPVSTPAMERSQSLVELPTSAAAGKRKETVREDSEGAVERMTQSAEQLQRSEGAEVSNSKPKAKKQVRIQSPTRSRGEAVVAPVPAAATPSSSSSSSSSSSRADHPDDVGVEEEAARIVDLLGPTVVQGTPAGDEALSKMTAIQKQEDEAARQAQEAIRIREEKARKMRENASKPAVGMSVMERSKKAVEAQSQPSPLQAQIQQAKASAFKRGFLNSKAAAPTAQQQPKSSTSSTPSTSNPRTSLGMSALDRSLINDRPIEAERQAQGLPPAVPHARPSKAYAEKMEKRRKGEAPDDDDSKQAADEKVVVGTGTRDDGSRVRFQLDAGGGDAGEDAQGDDDGDDGGSDADADDMAEDELDEHDEEAFARAAYASGDISDNEAGPSTARRSKSTTSAATDDDDDNGDSDSDWNLDSDSDGYDSADLADLEPSFDGLVSDLENAELAREYALAKARQMEARSKMTYEQRRDLERAISGEKDRSQNEAESSNLWTEEEIDGRHLSAVSGDREVHPEGYGGPPNKMSRFRASRIVKALGLGDSSVGVVPDRPEAGMRPDASEEDLKADAAGHELAHLLENAANLGPQGTREGGSENHPHASAHAHPQANHGYSYAMKEGNDEPVPPVMVLPSLTPLRYPRDNNDETTKTPAQLDESHPIPRDGIDLAGETDEDEDDDDLLDVMRQRMAEREQRLSGGVDDATPRPPAKPSREEGDGGMDRSSGTAMDAPPAVIGSASALRGMQRERGNGQTAPQPSVSRFKAARSATQQQQQQDSQQFPTPPPPSSSSSSPPAVAPPKVSRFKAARMARGEE